jgi:hypothetical protein
MVTRREYWREEEGSLESKILGCAGFNAVAPIAVYLHADLEYEKEALKGLRDLKKQCKHIPEVQNISTMDLKKGETGKVDIGHIYNRLYEMVAEDYGDIAVDNYGAWGHIDKCGKGHYGDNSSFFPFYTDEETLKKDLNRYDEECEEERY